jgi:hypothetical protein
MAKKGQGSLEYLLILAAILAIAVVVVVVANSLLGGGSGSAKVNADKAACASAGVELQDYAAQYTSATDAQTKVLKARPAGSTAAAVACTTTAAPTTPTNACAISLSPSGTATVTVGPTSGTFVCKVA